MKLIILLLAGCALCAATAGAQENQDQYVTVALKVADVGTYEIEVVIRGNEAFLPALQTFAIIGIKTDTVGSQKHLEGFLRSADSAFVIDVNGGQAEYAGHRYAITTNDYVMRGPDIYMSTHFLKDLFGLDLRFLSRRLQVDLRNTHELPVFTMARRRASMQRGRLSVNIPEPEVNYERRYDILSGSRLDWTFASRFSKQTFGSSRYSLNLGTMMLGGEFTGRVVGTASPHQTHTQLRGRIRYPIFGTSLIRQIVFGDYVSFGLLPREVTGLEVTNRPPGIRHVFTREVFSGQFEPNIDVGLVGGVEGFELKQTDDQGNYIMDAPVLYGQGLMEVHAYDPWGQERILRYRMNVPRTLIPAGDVEYSLSVGRFRPPSNMLMSANYVSWGVSPDLTVGAKLDYYDVTGDIPQAYSGLTATARVTRSLILNALVVPTAYATASADWLFPSSAQITFTHNRFAKNQLFNPSRMLDETDLSLLVPISVGAARFTANAFGSRTHFNEFRDDELQLALSAVLGNFSPRVSTRILSRDLYADGTTTPSHESDFSVGLLLPANVLFRGDVTYNHLLGSVETISGDIVKRFNNGLLFGISYFRLPLIDSYNLGFRLEYYFPMARAQAAVITAGTGALDYAVAANGSVGFSAPTSDFFATNRSNYVGYGGFIVHPFLDANGNGIADKGEESLEKGRVYFQNLSAGGQTRIITTNRLAEDKISGYEEFNLYLDPNSLDNPIWVPEYGTIRLISEPNYIQRVDIPVINGGFVRGTIIMVDATEHAAEGIKITLTPIATKGGISRSPLKSTTTFSTGEFEFSTVPPGRYILEVDASQIASLGVICNPQSREITVTSKPEGDIVGDQNFRLTGR